MMNKMVFTIALNKRRGNITKVSVAVPEGVIFGCHNKSFSLSGSPVNYFTDINKVLWLFEHPVDFIIVASAGIDHDMFVSVKEHESHFIV